MGLRLLDFFAIIFLILIGGGFSVGIKEFLSRESTEFLFDQYFTAASELKVVGKSPTAKVLFGNPEKTITGSWSGKKLTFVDGETLGDWVEFEILYKGHQKAKVEVYLTRSFDYGAIRLTVDDLTKDMNLWSPIVTPTGPVLMGDVDFKGRNFVTLRVEFLRPGTSKQKFRVIVDGVRVVPL